MDTLNPNAASNDYADAMRSARAARAIAWLVLALAILAQLASAIVANFTGLLDATHSAAASQAAPAANTYHFYDRCFELR